jgi:hypothetical protein
MAMTMRLSDGLKQEAETYANGIGISLNALISVALRDYLDSRSSEPRKAVQALPVPVPSGQIPAEESLPPGAARLLKMAAPQAVNSRPASVVARPSNPRGKCSCGSGKRWNQCHGREVQL